MNKFWFGLFAFLIFQSSLLADDYYAVQIGIFLNPRLSDFESIRPLGYLYAEEDEGNTYRIFLGDFDTPAEAEKIEKQLKQRGYLDAFVAQRTESFSEAAAVVQLGTRTPKETINWERFYSVGDIYVLSETNQVKIITGVYKNMDQAKADLQRIRQMGFADAFPKSVNSARLHELGKFELGTYKKALIPIQFGQSAISGNTRREEPSGNREFQSKGETNNNTIKNTDFYGYNPEARINPSTVENVSPASLELATPRIRTNVRRSSVLDLQKVLKSMKAYDSGLDGYYGDGTASGFARAANADATFKKYKLLARYANELNSTANNNPASTVQNAINQMPDNASGALRALESSNIPLAKAYRAYWLLQSSGASNSINNLMNSAIQETFATYKGNVRIPLDPRSTYAYNDVNQLIRHLTFLHQIQTAPLTMPCWLMSRHPNEVRNAMVSGISSYVSDDCNGFYQWEVVRVLKTISDDLSSDTPIQNGAALTSLYLAPPTLSQTEIQGMVSWNTILWQNLEGWENRDPLHQKITGALKLSYFQTQVLLEDHFMDKGFPPVQAKGLALATLRAIVGENLERFM